MKNSIPSFWKLNSNTPENSRVGTYNRTRDYREEKKLWITNKGVTNPQAGFAHRETQMRKLYNM